MSLNEAILNIMVEAGVSSIGGVSLHSGEPNASGSLELTGGSPAYARKDPLFNAVDDATGELADPLLFDIPPGSTVSWVGVWSMVSGGVFYGPAQLPEEEVFAGQGQYSLDNLTITGTSE